MLNLISSIPTTMREGFDMQDLPHRAASISLEHLGEVGGGSSRGFGCPRDSKCNAHCKTIPGRIGGYCTGFLDFRCVCYRK